MTTLIIGFILGAAFGITALALASAAGNASRDEEREIKFLESLAAEKRKRKTSKKEDNGN